MNYIYLYNNLIKLTTNKLLYKKLSNQDTFNDRLIIFLFHFAIFLKVFKNKDNEKELQKIYDFNFRQLELSIREIGYGDQSINKKMKDYINFFHAIVSDIHFWKTDNQIEKEKKLSKFLKNFGDITKIVEYFNDFDDNLSKKTFNSFIKSVSND